MVLALYTVSTCCVRFYRVLSSIYSACLLYRGVIISGDIGALTLWRAWGVSGGSLEPASLPADTSDPHEGTPLLRFKLEFFLGYWHHNSRVVATVVKLTTDHVNKVLH